MTVLIDPEDYAEMLAEMTANGGGTSLALRRKLAARAYARTAAYDAAIAGWFAGELGDTAPRNFALAGRLRQTLRYGENPHQSAAFYVSPARGGIRPGVATAIQVQGKELSYNNLNDTDAAYELAAEFAPASSCAVAIIKHANPCGVALGASLAEAYAKALACDRLSAFGGIIALNRTLDANAARAMAEIFTEVIIAPDATAEARDILARKKNLRLLLAGGLPDPKAGGVTLRTVAGRFLVQSRDNGSPDAVELKVATARAPTPQELADLQFAFRVCKHVKSNAIVFAKDGATVGIGAGQMSRVDSARIAAWKARAAADAGATAVIQPGGSMRDEEVIAAANERGLAMVLTGMRHFRH